MFQHSAKFIALFNFFISCGGTLEAINDSVHKIQYKQIFTILLMFHFHPHLDFR